MKEIKYFLLKLIDVTALNFLEPVVRLCYGEEPKVQLEKIGLYILVPMVAFVAFLGLWWGVADNIMTKSGKVPTPPVVWHEASSMWSQHLAAREQRADFYKKQEVRVAELEQKLAQLETPQFEQRLEKTKADLEKLEAENSPRAKSKRAVYESMASQVSNLEAQIENAKTAQYAGAPTYIDQIILSLKTVFFGFAIATAIALPIGILCGISRVFMAAMTPLISLFKPVSPIVWLPICGIIVGAYINADNSSLPPAFISSAITVALCSLWPTLVNTALGVASIDKDHINVARVLRLGFWSRMFKIIIPSSLPLIFTGLRISLGVGWMVLIAAELLATNPGLGKFVWDAFQNGSSQTFAQMFVAVFTVGIIGLLLDRIMVIFQRAVSFDNAQAMAI
ncbi:Binding-protein-dependent transport systems inner membrane component [Planctomycetales bacterium 10988]|nr:Binding-protein-dependent transport systems inner membrane component [Planctomycetales bacterium 10988]